MNSNIDDKIAKYSDLIEKTVALYKIRTKQYGLDMDDLKQICRIVIWNCLKYKSEDDPVFIPYIRASMRKALRSYIMKSTTGKTRQANDKSHNTEFIKTSELLVIPDFDQKEVYKFSTYDYTDMKLSVDSFVEYCGKKDPVLSEIINYRLSGYDGVRIAAMKKISYKAYLRRMRTIKSLYHEYFNDAQHNV